jgi:hypothetical protein
MMKSAGSDQSLQNRKRDQDSVLVRGSAAVVLSLRFVAGNQLTKMAATCAAGLTLVHNSGSLQAF